MSTYHALELIAKKKNIEHYLEDIKSAIQPVQESDILDRVLSLVMQSSMALKNVAPENNGTDNMPPSFTIKEKFAPAQKNEVQVPFKRTSKVPGRKKHCKQLR